MQRILKPMQIHEFMMRRRMEDINLDNLRSDLQASEIHELSQFIKTNNLLLGDKYSADSAGILTANIVESMKVTLDI